MVRMVVLTVFSIKSHSPVGFPMLVILSGNGGPPRPHLIGGRRPRGASHVPFFS
jgi:hypothetical protein